MIVERYKKERELPILDKVKFLVPQEFTVSNFCVVVRSKLVIRPSQSLHFIVGNKAGMFTHKPIHSTYALKPMQKLAQPTFSVPSMDMAVAELYNHYKDEDGFLYITYASTEMFG